MTSPRPDLNALFRDTLADILLRPWFDRTAVEVLGRWYFPLSRAWAAARACGGDAEAFAMALGLTSAPPSLLVHGPLRRMSALAEAHAAAEAAWEAALFADAPHRTPPNHPSHPNQTLPNHTLLALEKARHGTAHALMAARALFAPLHVARGLPPVRLSMADRTRVEAAHATRLADPGAAFAPPDDIVGGWRLSASLHAPDAVHAWLRRPAPRPYPDSADDRLRARVIDAPGATAEKPTLVFAHGIGMEEEFWRSTAEPLRLLGEEGIRLVRAEAPWHSHRMAEGWYGGEPVLGRGPLGLLDFMEGAVVELGLLIAWARRTSGGAPVAVGGISLGALTAQLAASVAHTWPAEMRPDAAFLVTPSASLTAVAFDGALTAALGLPKALAEAGWTRHEADLWRPLLEPQGPPACPPDHVVLVLGEEDRVTPYAQGRALAAAWGVPAENVFARPRGHFTSSLGLTRDEAPFRRLSALLHAC